MLNQRSNYWKLITLLFCGGWMFAYANRTVLSATMKVISSEWPMSHAALGFLNSAFFLSYALLQIPSGVLADKYGRKLVLVIGYFIHGLGALFSGLAWSPWSFLALRIFTGTGQSTCYSTQYALAAELIPEEHRGVGAAIINGGMGFGVALGLITGSFLTYTMGLNWRVSFRVLGGLSVGMAMLMWLFIGSDRKRKSSLAALPKSGRKSNQLTVLPKQVRLNLALSYVVSAVCVYSFYLLLTWLPFYMQEVRGFSGLQANSLSTLMPFIAVPSGIYAGRLSDRIGSRKQLMQILLPICTAGLLMIPLIPANWGIFAGLVVYGLTGKLVLDPLLVAFLADMAPKESYATILGIFNFWSALGMIAAPVITGLLADVTGSFNSGFYFAAILHGIGWLSVKTMKERRLERSTSSLAA